MQAFLIIYSVASDDYLYDANANLRAKIHSRYEARVKRLGHFSEPLFAYGFNGFIYSSPIDLLFKDGALENLLRLIDEKNAPNDTH